MAVELLCCLEEINLNFSVKIVVVIFYCRA